MILEETKLLNFENLVISEAKQKRDSVFVELSAEKKQKLDEIIAELEQNAGEKILNETFKIAREKNRRIIKKQSENKQELLNEREKLIDGVFAKVLSMLSDFMKTDEYVINLTAIIQRGKAQLSTTPVVVLSENDKKLEASITALDVVVEFTPDNIIGGCIIIDKKNNIQIDETYSSRLAMARDTFLETYNIKV